MALSNWRGHEFKSQTNKKTKKKDPKNYYYY